MRFQISGAWLRVCCRRLTKAAIVAGALLVLVAATVVGMFRMAAPLVPGYRTELEQWASAALHRPVDIRTLSADWGWFEPEITLGDVRIYSRDHARIIIQAQQVRLGISLWSLLHGRLPQPNRIVLAGPRVEAERDASGAFGIRGLEGGVTEGTTDWHKLLEDAFNQSATLVIEDGHLVYYEAGVPGHSDFEQVNLRIRNDADSHDLSGSLQLPQAFGRSLRFDLAIQGSGIDPSQWSWRTRVQGKGFEVPRLLSYWPAYKGRFVQGDADVDATLEGDGAALQSVQGELTARDVMPAAHGFSGTDSGSFGLIRGDIAWSRDDAGWTLAGRRVQLQQSGRLWPVSQFRLAYGNSSGADRWQGDASFLRLEDVAKLGGWLEPLLPAQTARLAHFAPAGDVSGIAFDLERRDGKLGNWSVSGGFQDLGMHAAEGLPGFTGLDGRVALDQTGGRVTLATRDATVDFRPLFRWPMQATSLDATVTFTHDSQGWRLASQGFRVANADASADGNGSLFFPADGSAPRLDLDATAHNAHARGKSAYFPVGIMDKAVVDWLDAAIVAGEVPEGTLSVHGKTSDFPYDHGGGVFDIRFHLLHGELDYAPGWPAVRDLDADVRFYNQGLEAHARSGTIQGDRIHDATAKFADLRTGVLQIDGGATGSAANALQFLRAGPLQTRFGHYLDSFKATGNCDVDLHLTLPVTQVEQYELHGTGRLRDASLMPDGLSALALQKLNGQFEFTGQGFSAKQVRGSLLGGPVVVSVLPPRDGKSGLMSFTADGTAEGSALSALFDLPQEAFAGHAAWHLDGQVPDNPAASTSGFGLSLRSSLKGLAVALPAPFGKDAASVTPVSLNAKLSDPQTFAISGAWTGRVRSRMNLVLSNGAWHLDRGIVNIGGGAANLPAGSGLSVTGTLPEFDWDAWKPYLVSAPGAPGTTTAPVAGVAPPPLLPASLQNMDFTLGRFTGFSQSTGPVHLTLSRAAGGWHGRIDGPAASGSVEIPQQVDATHPLKVNLDKLVLAKIAKSQGGQTAAPTSATAAPSPQYDPRHVPALDFTTGQFQYGDLHLDKVHAELVPLGDGVALQNLQVGNGSFALTGSGTWTVTPADLQQSTLSMDIKSHDVAKTLQSLGYAAALTGDSGEVTASLNWQDGPLGSNVVPTLGGTLHIKLEDGQLVDVQPGAGRVFGLLSINALPRRLLLNFSDVFAKGFHYDSIEGHFTLQDGDAYTPDLTVSGPAAKIHIVGRTGLAKHDFDEALVVNPSVGSTLPVVGALAGGVGVGAVVFLLTEIFRKPLTAAGESRYHLTGTWDNPALTKVTGPNPAPAPATKP